MTHVGFSLPSRNSMSLTMSISGEMEMRAALESHKMGWMRGFHEKPDGKGRWVMEAKTVVGVRRRRRRRRWVAISEF